MFYLFCKIAFFFQTHLEPSYSAFYYVVERGSTSVDEPSCVTVQMKLSRDTIFQYFTK